MALLRQMSMQRPETAGESRIPVRSDITRGAEHDHSVNLLSAHHRHARREHDSATRVSVCCGSPADAVTAGACCDPGAKREAVAGDATCCG